MAASERDIRPGDTVRIRGGVQRMTVQNDPPKDGKVRVVWSGPSGGHCDCWINLDELEHAPAMKISPFLDSIWAGCGLG